MITQELREKINQLNLMMEQVNGDYQVRFGTNTFDRFFYEPSTSLDKKPLEIKLNSKKKFSTSPWMRIPKQKEFEFL